MLCEAPEACPFPTLVVPSLNPGPWTPQLKGALFKAPEMCLFPDADSNDCEAANVYSCGVLLFVLLFGQHPFLPVGIVVV